MSLCDHRSTDGRRVLRCGWLALNISVRTISNKQKYRVHSWYNGVLTHNEPHESSVGLSSDFDGLHQSRCNMSAACQTSQSRDREQCVLLTLRAWMNTVAPTTLGEMNARVQTLGRPAKNLIAKCGGIRDFLKQFPELTLTEDKVEISLNSTVSCGEKLTPREISSRLNRLSKSEINVLNRNLSKLQIGPRTGHQVCVLQKRDQLDELRRRCDQKRSEIDALRKRLETKSPEDLDLVTKRRKELEAHRNDVFERLSEKEPILEEKGKLERLVSKLDRDIESKEDRLERLKLKSVYTREKLTMLKQDLFFDSRQHETLTHELLTQHSADLKKIATVFEVLVREKCLHSKTVLEAHIKAMEESNHGETSASRICRRKLSEILQKEEDFLGRIRDHRIDLQMISQLEIVTIDSIRSPLFEGKLREAHFPEQSHPVPETVPRNAESAARSGDAVAICAICLENLSSQPSEGLECLHSFHG